MIQTAPSRKLILLALVVVQTLFGINYVISKVVVTHFPPLLWASFRIILASLVMLTVSLIRRRKMAPSGRKFFIPLIGFAFLGVIINQVSFLVGLKYTTSTNSAILNTLIPVFTILILTVRGQEPLSWARGVGFISSFAGVLILRKVEQLSLSDKTLIGDLLMIVNCLSYAFFLSLSKKFFEQNDRLWTTTWLFIYGSIVITAVATPQWMSFDWPTMTPTLVACMSFAILGGTLLSYFLNNWALSYTRASDVAIFIYLQPVVAALLAWYWMGETITLRTAGSSLLIFLGIILVASRRFNPVGRHS
jgi:drug/metabolite transporter (DMT)-like permease